MSIPASLATSLAASLAAATPAEGLRLARQLAETAAPAKGSDMASFLRTDAGADHALTASFFHTVAAANGYWRGA